MGLDGIAGEIDRRYKVELYCAREAITKTRHRERVLIHVASGVIPVRVFWRRRRRADCRGPARLISSPPTRVRKGTRFEHGATRNRIADVRFLAALMRRITSRNAMNVTAAVAFAPATSDATSPARVAGDAVAVALYSARQQPARH